MKRLLNYTIQQMKANLTIKEYLTEKGFSHQILSRLKENPSFVLVNNESSFLNRRLKEGDTLCIIIPSFKASATIPVKILFEIIYEDEDILIINKSAGMPIHPSQNNNLNSLANALSYYFFEKGEVNFTFHCINRLDKDTDGLTIIAKNILSASLLGDMMKNRLIKREYIAIVDGISLEEGTINAPIARKADSIIEREVNFQIGEQAITHYKKISSYDTLSVLSIVLDSGRTHQIRVHMAYIGTPIIGDFLYHPTNKKINRQALSAHRLTFSHPITKEPLLFEIPLPLDMQEVIRPFI